MSNINLSWFLVFLGNNFVIRNHLETKTCDRNDENRAKAKESKLTKRAKLIEQVASLEIWMPSNLKK